MENKYNPFKMWGSYVGAIIGAFLITMFTKVGDISSFVPGYVNMPHFLWLNRIELFINFLVQVLSILIYGLLVFGIGFLIGWGVHSLLRRIRK